MNSLSELNNYSRTGITYTDTRPYSIAFANASPVNQTVTINEGSTHEVPIGVEITQLVSIPESVVYTVNVAALAGATITWNNPNNLPTAELSAGVYQIAGIISKSTWDVVKSPAVSLPRDYNGIWSYTSTINDQEGNVRSWTTTVTVNDLQEISIPTNHTYDEDIAALITGYPQILDVENDGSGTYSITLTPNPIAAVDILSSTGTGGTSSFNGSTKVLTISGNRGQVNSHLANVTLTPANDYTNNFLINYSLTNPISNLVSDVVQEILIGETNEEIVDMALNRFYKVDRDSLIFTGIIPSITEAGTYTIRFTANTTGGFISTTSAAVNWTAGTRTYEFTGTQAQCNNIFNTIKFWPDEDYSSTLEITYTQISGGTTQVIQAFDLISVPKDPLFFGTTNTPVFVDEDQQNIAITELKTIAPYWNDSAIVDISIKTRIWPHEEPFDAGVLSGTGGVWNAETKTLRYTFSAPVDFDDINNKLASTELDLNIGMDTDFYLLQNLGLDDSGQYENLVEYRVNEKTDTYFTVNLGSTWAVTGANIFLDTDANNPNIKSMATDGTIVVGVAPGSASILGGIYTRPFANFQSSSWTLRASGYVSDIIYSDQHNQFLAVGNNIDIGGSTTTMAYSSNGTTWAACTNHRVGFDDVNARTIKFIGKSDPSDDMYAVGFTGVVLKSLGDCSGPWTMLYGPSALSPVKGQLDASIPVLPTTNRNAYENYSLSAMAGRDDKMILTWKYFSFLTVSGRFQVCTDGETFVPDSVTYDRGAFNLQYINDQWYWCQNTFNAAAGSYLARILTSNDGSNWTIFFDKPAGELSQPARYYFDGYNHWVHYNPRSNNVGNIYYKPESGWIEPPYSTWVGSVTSLSDQQDNLILGGAGAIVNPPGATGRNTFIPRPVQYTFTIDGYTIECRFPYYRMDRIQAITMMEDVFNEFIDDNSLPWTVTTTASSITVNLGENNFSPAKSCSLVVDSNGSTTVAMGVSGNSFVTGKI